MALLPFLSDDDFLNHVSAVLKVGKAAKQKADEKFYNNVIDPFGAIFETALNDQSVEAWKIAEKNRQIQKTLQNAIGNFHNDVLGSISGWEKPASEIDLVNHERKIIAEVKNKYNTVSGGKLVDHYEEFDRLVNNKSSRYFGYSAYLVQVIPKTPKPYDKCFTPSDKSKGNRKAEDEKIREIDGRSFYALATNVEEALAQLHRQIPHAIKRLSEQKTDFTNNDLKQFEGFFTRAYQAYEQIPLPLTNN